MHCTSCGSLLPPGSLGTTICPTCGASNFVPLSSSAQPEPASQPGEAEAMAGSPVFQETVSSPRPQQPPQPQQAEWIAAPFYAFSSPPSDIDKRTTGYGPAYQFSEADAPTIRSVQPNQPPVFPPAPTPTPTPAPFSSQAPLWQAPPQVPPQMQTHTQPDLPAMPPISPVPPMSSVPSMAPMSPVPPARFAPPPAQSRRGLSRGTMIAVIVLSVLLILAGSGLIYYSAIFHPAQLHADATAPVQATYPQQAHMTATANAEATGTAIAEANATATANAQATAIALATATAEANIYTQGTSGTPALSDSLSYPNNWANEYGTNGGGCNFSAGAYHITEPTKGYFLFCPALGSNFSNLTFQVNIDIIAGDSAGIGIRGNEAAGSAYYFTIYVDGTYDSSVWKNNNGDDSRSLQSGTSTSIKSGHNQINLVTIIARNHTFYLFVNKHFIASAQDSSFSSGEIGLFAGDQTHAADVAFSNAKVWRL